MDRNTRDFFLITLPSDHYLLSSRKLGSDYRCGSPISLLHHSHLLNEVLGDLRSYHKEDFGSSYGDQRAKATGQEGDVPLSLKS